MRREWQRGGKDRQGRILRFDTPLPLSVPVCLFLMMNPGWIVSGWMKLCMSEQQKRQCQMITNGKFLPRVHTESHIASR